MAQAAEASLLAVSGVGPGARRRRLKLYRLAEWLCGSTVRAVAGIVAASMTGLEKLSELSGVAELKLGAAGVWGFNFALLGVLLWAGVMRSRRHTRAVSADTRRIFRLAGPGDAWLLSDTLKRSLPGAPEEDISPPAQFDRWLAGGNVVFVVVEAVTSGGRFLDSLGFYSIYPLKLAAFEAMCRSELHHDDLGQEHFGRLRTSFDQPPGGEPLSLFVLDVEAVADAKGKPLRRVGAALVSDLARQVSALVAMNEVRSISSLGASSDGHHWSVKMGMQPVGKDYFDHVHGAGWTIYAAGVNELRALLGALRQAGWSDRARPYPRLVDGVDYRAMDMLNGVLRQRRPPG